MGLKGIPEGEVLEIVSDIVRGLLHMHMQNPPIAHRDIKVSIVIKLILFFKLENVLRGSDNQWKICDFGSSSTITHNQIHQDVS